MKNYLLLSVIVVGLFSCVGAKKMREVSAKLQDLEVQQSGESDKIKNIASTGEAKLAERKIDSNINERLDQRLSSIRKDMDSINKEIANLKSLTSDIKKFRKNYQKEIVPKLAQLDTFYKRYDDRLKIYLMMEDALNTTNYVLFDLAAFFGSGLYNIPPGQESLAVQSFLPLIDSLVKFSNKYQNISRTATLVVIGYADGQDINRCSNLYDTLSDLIDEPVATKQLLNKKLSELRDIELIKQLTAIFAQRVTTIKNLDQFNVEYIGQGKGEEYPMPSIKDYKENDERRRIVLCYWAVLPNLP